MDGSVGQDFKAIAEATQHLGVHMYTALAFSFHSHTILQYLAVIAAIYLFILDRTNWRTNILTSLLVPYIALNLPSFLLGYIRGEIGYWVAFVAVVLRLFFPKNFPDEAELPASLLLLLVTAPSLVVNLRFELPGEIISVAIGFYLLYEHIIAAGGFRKAFAERGVPISIGIILLFVAPFYQLITGIF